MKTLKIFLGVLAASLLISCEGMLDNIEQYIKDGETLYVGKVDSLKIYPGRERVELKGNLNYGFSQTRCTIEWQHPSGERQVKEIDIERKSPDDILDVVLTDMQEGPYEFTVTTYDASGNKSIPVKANGYVYGDLYEESLINRSIDGEIVTGYLDGNFTATVKWMPLNYSEALATILTYELADGSGTETLEISTAETSSVIRGAKPGGEFNWYTVYKPDTLAIDLFNTQTAVSHSSTKYKIPVVNPGNPFTNDGRGLAVMGRFGYVDGWTANAAAEANGTFDTWGGRQSLSMWTYPNYSPAGMIENGKIYQKITLPEGSYRFDIHLDSYNPKGPPYDVYGAVATGISDGLPDVADLEKSALGYANCPNDVTNNLLSVPFVLEAPAEVSFGIVGIIGGEADINVKYVELWSN